MSGNAKKIGLGTENHVQHYHRGRNWYQSTDWIFQEEPKPTKVVRSRSTSKKMIVLHFRFYLICSNDSFTVPKNS